MNNLEKEKEFRENYNNGDCDDVMFEGVKQEAKELLEEIKEEPCRLCGDGCNREAIKILEGILK